MEADPGQQQAGEVGQHVAGVCQQGQRTRQKPANHLCQHEQAGQERGKANAALVCAMSVIVTVTLSHQGVT